MVMSGVYKALADLVEEYCPSNTHNLFGVFMYGEPSNTIHTLMHLNKTNVDFDLE